MSREATQSGSSVPIIDPTANVLRDIRANKEHADEMRVMHDRVISSEIAVVMETVKWMEKLADVHQKHDYALHKAEAGRLDALRQNDREDVKLLAAQTVAKADALQNQLSVTATTLQSQVLTTAETLAKSIAADQAEQNKRLSAIEKQQAEGAGKGTGTTKLWGFIFAGCGLALAAAGFILTFLVVLAGIVVYAVRAGG